MSKKIGFIDEYGDKSILFEKDGVSLYFIVTAVIVDENNIDSIKDEFNRVAKEFTKADEIKSKSKQFRKLKNRIEFLEKIDHLNYKVYSIVVDKRKIFEDSGLQFRNVFFKYVNGLLDRELYDYFPFLELVADKHGDDEFMKEFINYIESNHKQVELFRGPTFKFADSKDEILIQLADLISGSISKIYDPKYFDEDNSKLKELLERKILHVREWPTTPLKFYSNITNEDEKYDSELVEFLFFRINEFMEQNQDSNDIEIKHQLAFLNYMIYRFKSNPYSYVYSDEILERLNLRGYSINKRMLNKDIISKLRENKVLITSSTTGYKLPCCKGDFIRFYNNYSSKIIPMLDTVNKVDILIKTPTFGNYNLLENNEYKLLKELINTASR